MNLNIATLMKVDGSHQELSAKHYRLDNKNLSEEYLMSLCSTLS